MCKLIFCTVLVFIITLVVKTCGMSLNGITSTRYDPCGLGIVHFDKDFRNNSIVWSGLVDFTLYPDITKAEIEMHFAVPLKSAWETQRCNMVMRNKSTYISMRVKDRSPRKCTFFIELEDNIVPRLRNVSLNNEVLCSEQDKQVYSATLFNSTIESHRNQHCGRRTLDRGEVVTVGGEATPGEWPWHVAIFLKDDTKEWYQCGGSILTEDSVLTAAHCLVIKGVVQDLNSVTLVAGATNFRDINAPGVQKLKAKKIIIHPSHNGSLATADLAIIKVEGFKFNEYVQPICIWGPVYDKQDLIGKHATIVGFGRSENGTFPNVLRTAHTIVQSDNTCISYAPKLYPNLLNEFTFCAGYGPKSIVNPRNGDSGGGLFLAVQQPDHHFSFILRGVLSRCGMEDNATLCDPKFYVVFADVAPNYAWIYHHAGYHDAPKYLTLD